MQHNPIVREEMLHQQSDYADTRGLLPDLVLRLLAASVPDPTELRIPVRGAVGQKGWDGILNTPVAFKQFVPAGKSYWEMGTGADPEKKANLEYDKRDEQVNPAEKLEATFVFVTSRSAYRVWSKDEQTAWIESKKALGKWRDIRVVDATILVQWLAFFPAIDLWLACEFSPPIETKGLSTPFMHWDVLCTYGHPPNYLKPELFIQHRESAQTMVKDLVLGKAKELLIQTRYPEEVADFISAALMSFEGSEQIDYSSRCLIIEDRETWKSMCDLTEPHILIAKPKLDVGSDHELRAIARRRHAVVFAGPPQTTGHSNTVQLREYDPHELQSALENCGYPTERARRFSLKSQGRISVLKRLLMGLSASPSWTERSEAADLALFALLGAIDENARDTEVVSSLGGKTLGEWSQEMRPLTLVVDPPLIHHSGRWKFVSRYEGWTWLGRHLVDGDLKKFAQQALIVLRELDKRLELDKEERALAVSTKDDIRFSRLLRQGLSEGLALLGSHDAVLQSCSPNAGPNTAAHVVRELLGDGDWKLWCSLNDVMPLLAEAAPDEFLDAVEAHLRIDDGALFRSLFDQETAGFFGATYTTGLLWALETLAWHSDYLTRTTVVLGKLAALDPGGNWANRPSNSLTTIFLPWLPQTLASIEQRTNAVATLSYQRPDTGWKLLLSLLPKQSTSTSGSHKPVWRTLIPEDYQRNVSHADYWSQVKRYSELAVSIAKEDHDRTVELIDKLDQLVPEVISEFLEYLESEEVRSMVDEQRLPIWERLFALSMGRKRFPERDGLLSMPDFARVDQLVITLQPSKASARHRRLFGEREFEVMEDVRGKFDEQRKELDARRQVATAEILDQEGIEGVIQFARGVHNSGQVGVALGNLPGVELDDFLLPSYLKNEEKSVQHFIGGYAWAKYWRLSWAWIDALSTATWSDEQAAAFFADLPFNKGIWTRAEARLGEKAASYWRALGNINPYHATEDIFEATRLLLKHGRARLALDCLGHARHKDQLIPSDLIAEVLIANLGSAEPLGSMLQHEITELIGALQEHPEKNVNQVRSIELAYLPMLEYGYAGSPLFLDRGLAEDPQFFCEVIALVYKPEGRDDIEGELPTEAQRNLAERAFRLLHRWKLVPGTKTDEPFDASAFSAWVAGVKTVASQTGYLKSALRQVGQVVAHLPVAKDGLGIPEVVARFLDEEEDDFVRRSFSNGLYNKRGTHGVTGGIEERKLAKHYADWAQRVDGAGLVRLAKTLRDLSRTYEHEAKEEEGRAVLEREGMR